jgi:2-polyprenyl-6-methoxyphenol hydroxylase-like FAD-dependent oxidoreductase
LFNGTVIGFEIDVVGFRPLALTRGDEMANVERILVVGGGIAGLSAAIALHRKGLTPVLVERSAAWPAVGAGINLPANGVRVLRALGLGDALDRVGAVIRQWAFYDQKGKLLCATDLEDLWCDVGPCLGVTRVRLQETLLSGVADVVRCRLGVSLTALTQVGESVCVTFSDDTSETYDLVIGADGIHSTVRRLAIRSLLPTYAGQMVWRSVIPSRPPGIVEMMVLMGEERFFGLVPMGEGWTYGFGAVDGQRFEDPLEGRLERLRQRFAGFGGPVPAYLAALQLDTQLHLGPIEWVDVEEWYRGRVVLIGDAAHAGPPHMGEGGCMAMEDALVLAEILSTSDTVPAALQLYVQRRRPRAEWVQSQSRAAAQAWVLPLEVRNAVLRERGDQMFRERYRPLIPGP